VHIHVAINKIHPESLTLHIRKGLGEKPLSVAAPAIRVEVT
jgi:hypothetical protein